MKIKEPQVQLENELESVIERYRQESDLTIVDLLGTLEWLKAKYIKSTLYK